MKGRERAALLLSLETNKEIFSNERSVVVSSFWGTIRGIEFCRASKSFVYYPPEIVLFIENIQSSIRRKDDCSLN